MLLTVFVLDRVSIGVGIFAGHQQSRQELAHASI